MSAGSSTRGPTPRMKPFSQIGREDLLLVQDALDLVEQLLALLAVALARLALEEVLHLGQHARGVGAALASTMAEPRGRVAARGRARRTPVP